MNATGDLLILSVFEAVEDPRKRKNSKNFLYPLCEILLVAFATILSGGEGYGDMHEFGNSKLEFFKGEWPNSFKNGVASADTFERVFGLLNPIQFEECLVELTKYMQLNYGNEIISIDGKSVNGARTKGSKPLHLVNAWARNNRVVLSCKAVEDKTNEITVIPEVLKALVLKNTIVTIDAMGCQYLIANQIIKQEGNYVIALKGNQGALYNDIKTFFDFDKEDIALYKAPTEKNHGRIEKRLYGFTDNVAWIAKCNPQWHTIKGIGFVLSERIIDGKSTTDMRYFISSMACDVKTFATAVRAHWGIENSLHYILDTAFREDESRVRNRNAATNLAILRRMAINKIAEKKEPKKSKRRMKLRAGWDNHYLKMLLNPI